LSDALALHEDRVAGPRVLDRVDEPLVHGVLLSLAQRLALIGDTGHLELPTDHVSRVGQDEHQGVGPLCARRRPPRN